MAVLIGDGVKQAKEGRGMPVVKKLCQESENSAEPEFLHGHMFGGMALLAGDPARELFFIPLRLHESMKAAVK